MDSKTTPRKGATRTSEIPADVLQALSRGEISSATLTEGLALDQMELLRTVFPQLPAATLQAAEGVCSLGILKRMTGIGTLLWQELGTEAFRQCHAHPSDTVRAWACFMVGAQQGLSVEDSVKAIRPFADDEHFGVREWAWMAVRPLWVPRLDEAIKHLSVWTTLPSERLRRFACEALRPRGVWCAHIAALKQQPEKGLPILQPLHSDPSSYVQDSVANWLNDAAKDQPQWVQSLCQQWLQGEPSAATRRICTRAMRSVKG